MKIDISPMSYLTLCGLVKDAAEIKSDASFMLDKALGELKSILGAELPDELNDNPQYLDALRRVGFLKH